MILIGSTRHNKDKEYVEQLRIMINDLNINNEVEFKLNITFKELKTQFDQAMIGLNTTRNEQFGIGLYNLNTMTLKVFHTTEDTKYKS